MLHKMLSVRFALRGIKIAWQQEFSFKVHVVLGILAVLFGWLLRITTTEWIVVVFMIGFVLSAEAVNTALEELCDKFQSEHDPRIGKIKDLAAAAVLIAAITAFLVGAIIFLPRFLGLI